MNERAIEHMTEAEFLDLVKKKCKADYATQHQHGKAILEFERLSEHPDGSDLIYYPEASADNSPQGIVNTIKEWRAANGKTGFKSEH
ncbi:bacteriocin immunity protein [Pseudomonas sp. LP_7_YM]|uniref:bacteriocin immunity protein n=1 Tax=Pseudomonas sp. LP_7_YM TaxID=2485137 RepID=UPI00105FCCBC|nr:bacteriocin immunity protein [Pseudomonas sp. LP_7_YM]TDV64484.1 colicin immunity protein/pyocin immunity protein [Pseudomonas sp. LP_7_YM]